MAVAFLSLWFSAGVCPCKVWYVGTFCFYYGRVIDLACVCVCVVWLYYSVSLAYRFVYLPAFGLNIWIEIPRPWPCIYMDIRGGLCCSAVMLPVHVLLLGSLVELLLPVGICVVCLFLVSPSSTLVPYPSKPIQRSLGRSYIVLKLVSNVNGFIFSRRFLFEDTTSTATEKSTTNKEEIAHNKQRFSPIRPRGSRGAAQSGPHACKL